MRIGIVGYGSVGSGLGRLFVGAGHQVVVGLREGAACPDGITSIPFSDLAGSCDLILLAVPYTAVKDIAPALAATAIPKLIVDATNPLGDDWSPLDLGSQNSAGEEIQRLFPRSSVVKAFNTVFADNFTPERLTVGKQRVTAFLAGNDIESRDLVAGLARDAGFDPVHAGDITKARYLEAVAHLNIQLAVAMEHGTDSGILHFSRS